MGCDAPVGWNDAAESYKEKLKKQGWVDNGSPTYSYTCLECGASVKNVEKFLELHKKFHAQIKLNPPMDSTYV